MTTTQFIQAVLVLGAVALTLVLAVAPQVMEAESGWFLHPASDRPTPGVHADR